MPDQKNGQTVERPDEGIRLYVPSQPGTTAQPRLENYDTVPGNKPGYKGPKSTSSFTVIRALVSFEVLANPNVDTFSKPARLTVCYKQSDVDTAGGKKKLRLGAWDGNKWRILPQNRSVDCPFPDKDFVGAVEVLLTRPWADPPVAWGGGG